MFGKFAEYMPNPEHDAKVDLSHIAQSSMIGRQVAQIIGSRYQELYEARLYERLEHGVLNDELNPWLTPVHGRILPWWQGGIVQGMKCARAASGRNTVTASIAQPAA